MLRPLLQFYLSLMLLLLPRFCRFYLTPMLLPLLREMPAGKVGVDVTCKALQVVTVGAKCALQLLFLVSCFAESARLADNSSLAGAAAVASMGYLLLPSSLSPLDCAGLPCTGIASPRLATLFVALHRRCLHLLFCLPLLHRHCLHMLCCHRRVCCCPLRPADRGRCASEPLAARPLGWRTERGDDAV